MSLNFMVAHTRIPYAECIERHRESQRVARLLGADLLAGLLMMRQIGTGALKRWFA